MKKIKQLSVALAVMMILLLHMYVGANAAGNATANATATYTVTFYDYNNNVIKTENVQYRKDAIPPNVPRIEGRHFAGWYGNYFDVRNDENVYALYTSSAVSLATTPFEIRQGGVFTTTLYIPNDANILSFEISLLYDTEKLSLIKAEKNSGSSGNIEFNTETPGKINVAFDMTSSNVTEYVPLLDFTFKADDYLSAGIYKCFSVDEKGATAYKLSGNNRERVDLSYDFCPLSIYEIGDVDLSSRVDIGDVSDIRRHYVHLITLSDFQLSLSDVQYDSIYDIGDAAQLQRKLVMFEGTYGDRENVEFYDIDGNKIGIKSVVRDTALEVIPAVPNVNGRTNGKWSLSRDEYIEPDFGNISSSFAVYPFYEKEASPYMQYYLDELNREFAGWGGYITKNWNLTTSYIYPEDRSYTGSVIWSVSNANIFDKDGVFNQPTYDTPIVLTAKIYSYHNGEDTPESSAVVTYSLIAKGAYSTPTKAEIVSYLAKITGGRVSDDGKSSVTGGRIDCDLNLIRKVSNQQVNSNTPYEVHIDWTCENTGYFDAEKQAVKRGTYPAVINLIANITFNGEPLEDGKVYFYDVNISAITQDEVRSYVINQIADHSASTIATGEMLWAGEKGTEMEYGCEIRWRSDNKSVITAITDNVVSVNEDTVSGTTCPITAEVSYAGGSFTLSYVIAVETGSSLLQAGKNIDESLYYALKMELDKKGISSAQITTEVLKNTKFVTLDLSTYSKEFTDGAGDVHAAITDLTGLSYCENLRLLNISDLKITNGLSEISSLSNLESFIANNCDITDFADGDVPVLVNAINLKLLDLANNKLISLDGVLSSDKLYGKLKELYLNNNEIENIDRLENAPLLSKLALSANNLESGALNVLSKLKELNYLSLSDNDITDISALETLTSLTELRLQCNKIRDVSPLQGMTELTSLYIGDNQIGSIDCLEDLVNMEILYLNNNEYLDDVAALGTMKNLTVLNISGDDVSALTCIRNSVKLKELYAENANIRNFAFLTKLTSVEKLLLSGNPLPLTDVDWNKYLSEMTNLKVLTLSGQKVTDLSFLQTIAENSATQTGNAAYKPIERLELSDCRISVEIQSDDNTTINNIRLISDLRETLRYLDISNNNITGDVSPLNNLDGLEMLYADNIFLGDYVDAVMYSLTSIKYLSLENTGIDNVDRWIDASNQYIFIDLANNPIDFFSFVNIRKCLNKLQYLYLDTTAENAALAYGGANDNNIIKALSLKGFEIPTIEILPKMPYIEYLNLSGTKLSDFFGKKINSVDNPYPNSIAKYTSLKVLDVGDNDNVFTKANLNLLYDSFCREDMIVYMYSDHDKTGFDGNREALYIRKFITEVPETTPEKRMPIHTFYDDSDNVAGPVDLQESVNGYVLDWEASDYWFQILDNTLSVKNWDMKQNQDLLMYSGLDVYDNDNSSEQISAYVYVEPSPYKLTSYTAAFTDDNFDDNAKTENVCYFNVGISGYDTAERAGKDFTSSGWYTEKYGKGESIENGYRHTDIDDNGNVPDMSIYAEWHYTITYDFNGGEFEFASKTQNSNDTVIYPLLVRTPSGTEMEAFDGWYNDGTVIEAGRYRGGNITLTAKWLINAYNIILDTNGGSINSGNVSNYIFTVGAVLPTDVVRTGYTFEGWYTEEENDNGTGTRVYAVSETQTGDVKYYAKWTIGTYMVEYIPNTPDGASSSVTKMPGKATWIYDVGGTLGQAPSLTGYTFGGWYKDAACTVFAGNADTVPESINLATSGTVSLYAKWTANTYTIVYDANVGNGSTAVSTHVYDTVGKLTANGFSRSGYIFQGWADSADGSVAYGDGESVENLSSTDKAAITLYAVWKVDPYTIGRYVDTGTEVRDSDGENTYTVYNSIDSTPRTLLKSKTIVDWSSETDTDLLNHPLRFSYDDVAGYDHLEIRPGAEEVIFIGSPSKAFTNLRTAICLYEKGQKLTMRLVNFKCEANIWLYEDKGVELTVDVIGDCSIGAPTGTGRSIIDMPNNTVNFTGSGNITLTAGDGSKYPDSSVYGRAGGEGGIAVNAEYLNINMTGKFEAHGGNGGDGTPGKPGWVEWDNFSADCGPGGYGGNGNFAIKAEHFTVSEDAEVILQGGDGGDGRDGGNGGTMRHNGQLVVDCSRWHGINGGNGGGAGLGASAYKIAGSNTVLSYISNVHAENGSDGKTGEGGACGYITNHSWGGGTYYGQPGTRGANKNPNPRNE